MKKIIFRYSAMNAGKSANLIMTYHNYIELGLNTIAVIPNSSKNKRIYSRIGIGIKAIKFKELKEYLNDNDLDCVLVDEVQFLSKEDIEFLNQISIHKNVTVICYGLRTTSTGDLFEGSKYLLAIADELEELPTLCFCGKKARMSIRAVDGIIDRTSEVVKLREEQKVSYISVCRRCFDKYFNDKSKNDISNLIEKFDNTKNIKKGEISNDKRAIK